MSGSLMPAQRGVLFKRSEPSAARTECLGLWRLPICRTADGCRACGLWAGGLHDTPCIITISFGEFLLAGCGTACPVRELLRARLRGQPGCTRVGAWHACLASARSKVCRLCPAELDALCRCLAGRSVGEAAQSAPDRCKKALLRLAAIAHGPLLLQMRAWCLHGRQVRARCRTAGRARAGGDLPCFSRRAAPQGGPVGVVNNIKAANLWGCRSGYVRSVAAVLRCAQTRAAVQRVALSVFVCSGFPLFLPVCSASPLSLKLAPVSLLRPALRVRGVQPKRLGRAQGRAPDVLHISYWLHISCWLICLTTLHNRGAPSACW